MQIPKILNFAETFIWLRLCSTLMLRMKGHIMMNGDGYYLVPYRAVEQPNANRLTAPVQRVGGGLVNQCPGQCVRDVVIILHNEIIWKRRHCNSNTAIKKTYDDSSPEMSVNRSVTLSSDMNSFGHGGDG